MKAKFKEQVFHVVIKSEAAKIWIENQIGLRKFKSQDMYIDYAQSYESFIEEQKQLNSNSK